MYENRSTFYAIRTLLTVCCLVTNWGKGRQRIWLKCIIGLNIVLQKGGMGICGGVLLVLFWCYVAVNEAKKLWCCRVADLQNSDPTKMFLAMWLMQKCDGSGFLIFLWCCGVQCPTPAAETYPVVIFQAQQLRAKVHFSAGLPMILSVWLCKW